jgi:hypothetical protein
MDQMAAELQRDADATEDAVLSQCMRQMAAELQRDDAGATEDSGMSPDLYTAVSPEEVDQTDRQEPLVSTDYPDLPDPAVVAPGDVGSSDGDDDGSIQSPVFSDGTWFSEMLDDEVVEPVAQVIAPPGSAVRATSLFADGPLSTHNFGRFTIAIRSGAEGFGAYCLPGQANSVSVARRSTGIIISLPADGWAPLYDGNQVRCNNAEYHVLYNARWPWRPPDGVKTLF